jgi:DNA-binding CsgD family transcriptional regulator
MWPELSASSQKVVAAFADRYELSGRETAVIALAAAGLHRKAAADRLGCSAATIDTYWRRVFKKSSTKFQSEVMGALFRMATSEQSRGIAPTGGDSWYRIDGHDKQSWIGYLKMSRPTAPGGSGRQRR